MKIPLNMGQNSAGPSTAKPTACEAEILAAQKGDWVAKKQLARKFSPLIQSLAAKRANDPATVSALVEAGQEGLYFAARKYKKSLGADKFSVFSLGYIQKAMDRLDKNKPNLLSRLFSR